MKNKKSECRPQWTPASTPSGGASAAKKIEHNEIGACGAARTHARRLGYVEAVRLLQMIRDEEAAADAKLTKIAESGVNAEAVIGARQPSNGSVPG